MNNRFFLILIAASAGFLGGLIPNWFVPHVVRAQNREIPDQVWAHEFVLAGKDGAAEEVIGIEYDGKPSIEFLKRNGKVQTVRFNGSTYVVNGPRHPTLLPIKP